MSRRTAEIISIFLLAGVAFLSRSSIAQAAPAPSGKMVDLGGHRLHVDCTGKGQYTVVVETGGAQYES